MTDPPVSRSAPPIDGPSQTIGRRGPAEQERIARAVIDSDDACWLFDSANAQDTAAGAGASREVKDAGCEEGSTGGGKIPSGPSRGAGRSRIDAPPLPRRLRLIGGVDVSFVKGSEDNACATLVVLEFPSLNVVYEASNRVTMEYPYVSGFLAFREVYNHVDSIYELPGVNSIVFSREAKDESRYYFGGRC